MWIPDIPFQIESPLALIISSTLLGKLTIDFWNMAVEIYQYSHKSISELMLGEEAGSVFRLIPEVFCEVEVRAVYRTRFFSPMISNSHFVPCFVHRGIVMLEQVWDD